MDQEPAASKKAVNYLKGLDEQYGYDEYVMLLQDYHDDGIERLQPDMNDPQDALYRKKYVHNMPPLAAYLQIPPLKDRGGNTQENPDTRKIYTGWDNLTNFEIQKI